MVVVVVVSGGGGRSPRVRLGFEGLHTLEGKRSVLEKEGESKGWVGFRF